MNAPPPSGHFPQPVTRVVQGVTGGIAAYKTAELVRLFVKAGIAVDVVMTAAATRFVTATTFQALSGFAYSALFNSSGGQHALLFMIAAGAIVVALALELGMIVLNRRPLDTVPTHTLIAAGNLK